MNRIDSIHYTLRKQNRGYWGLGMGGQEFVFNGHRVSVQIMNKFWRWTVVMVAKHLFFFFFLGPHLQHMEVLGLGVKLGLQLPAYITSMAVPILSHVCDLRHGLWQRQILNPLREAGMELSPSRTLCQVLNPLSHSGNSRVAKLVNVLSATELYT